MDYRIGLDKEESLKLLEIIADRKFLLDNKYGENRTPQQYLNELESREVFSFCGIKYYLK